MTRAVSEEFGRLLEASRPGLYRQALRLTHGHVQDAQDLVQDTLVRAYERLHTFRAAATPSGARPWLSVILRNLFLNGRCRDAGAAARASGPPLSLDALPEACHPRTSGAARNPPEAVLLAREREEAAVAAIALLPQPYREALVLALTAEGDMTYADLSSRLGLPTGTVRSRLSRARRRVRECMEAADKAAPGTAREGRGG